MARRAFRNLTLIAIAVLAIGVTVSAQEASVEEELHVHRLGSEMTSPYDAFAYSNRVPTDRAEGESAAELSGRVLYSRLPNVEGRIQLKVVDGFDRSEYLGYKTFMRAWPEPGNGVGNCVVCHTPSSFTDETARIVDASGEAKAIPSLRNLGKSDEELTAVVLEKLRVATEARAGNVEVDEAYNIIELSDEDVTNIVAFLQSLNEVPKEEFRDLITDAVILDTSDMLR